MIKLTQKKSEALCHHPLVKGHIKPGDKICKIREKHPDDWLTAGFGWCAATFRLLF